MKKALDTSGITNELKQSVFFHSKEEKQPEKPKLVEDAQLKEASSLPSRNHDTMIPRHHTPITLSPKARLPSYRIHRKRSNIYGEP